MASIDPSPLASPTTPSSPLDAPATQPDPTLRSTPQERRRIGWVIAVTLTAIAVLIIVVLYAVEVL